MKKIYFLAKNNVSAKQTKVVTKQKNFILAEVKRGENVSLERFTTLCQAAKQILAIHYIKTFFVTKIFSVSNSLILLGCLVIVDKKSVKPP